MNPEKLFLFASFFEARSLLDGGEFVKQFRDYFIYENTGILITGVGPEKTKKTLEKHRPRPRCALNIGLCGALNALQPGEVFNPAAIVSRGELQISNTIFPLLVTVKNPVESSARFFEEAGWQNPEGAMAADMEGAVLQAYFEPLQIPLKVIKIVSDAGKEDFKAHFKERKELLLKKLADVAKSQL